GRLAGGTAVRRRGPGTGAGRTGTGGGGLGLAVVFGHLDGELAADEIERIDLDAVAAHLEVQVRAGRIAGRADAADGLAGEHLGPAPRLDAAQVGIEGAQAVGVTDLDEIAIAAIATRGRDHAFGRGQDARAGRRGDVHSGVLTGARLAGEAAQAEARVDGIF